jgi:hypothetical protein
MGIISSIRAALGLASSDRPNSSNSAVLPPHQLKQIPYLPNPPAPSNWHQLQTATPPKLQKSTKSIAEVPLTINVNTLPNFKSWIGPLPLTKDAISRAVIPYKPGHFFIGTLHDKGSLIVKMMGRSSNDLHAELEKFIGEASHFMAHVDPTARDSFLEACILFHCLGRHVGIKHPMRSYEEGWGCPKCGIFNPGT